MTANDWIQLVLYFARARAAGEAAGLVHGPRLPRRACCGLDRVLGWLRARHLSRRRASTRQRKWGGGSTPSPCCCSTPSACSPCTRLLRLQGSVAAQSARICRPTRRISRSTRRSALPRNTNWQSYGGETTMSYLTQMLGLTVQNFVSAATGMAVLVALIRGLARRTATTIGNFWVDLVRSTLYILLPLSLLWRSLLVSQGVVQNFEPYDTAELAASRRRRPTARTVDDADAGAGPGGVADRDQATRHQRRRLLQRQLGASVRESDAAVELPGAAVRSC